MSTDAREQLRQSMERFTGDVEVPAGLAGKVVRRYRRRRAAVLAVVACGAVAVIVAGFALSGLGTSSPGVRVPGGTHGASKAYTVAYVMRQAAQAAAGQRRLIQYARSVDLGAPARGYEVSWTRYDTRSCVGSYRREDIVGGMVQMQYATTWRHSGVTDTAVNYPARAWARSSSQLSSAERCNDGPSFPDYRSVLEWGLRHKRLLRIAGTVKVDGVQTIKIVSAPPLAGLRPTPWVIWVNPRTYLPVRTLVDSSDIYPAVYRVDLRTDYVWLPPTRANLANLTVAIPAGFKRRTQSQVPMFDACGFIPCF